MNKLAYLLAIPLLACSTIVGAHNIQVGQLAPSVSVKDKGEILYTNKAFEYAPWSSAQLAGKVRVVQAMAGRTSAKEMNDPLMQALIKADLPHDRYQTTTIVNTDDAIFATASFVRSKIEENKKARPYAQFIIDRNGVLAKAWQLKPEGSAILLLDQQGKVLFVKDGALNSIEVQALIAKIKSIL